MKKSKRTHHRTTVNLPVDLKVRAQKLARDLSASGPRVDLTDLIVQGLQLIIEKKGGN